MHGNSSDFASLLKLSSLYLQCFDLLVGWQEGHPACKKLEWWGAGVVICLERGADLHTAQLMPLPLTVSCFSKTQTGFPFLVPAHPSSPGKRAVERMCVCVCLNCRPLGFVMGGDMDLPLLVCKQSVCIEPMTGM